MFGIPNQLNTEFRDSFLSAWKEPFHGVTLSWLELVIINEAVKPKSINDVWESLSSKYSFVRDMNLSKFYRIVNGLVAQKYLTAEKSGREKTVQATSAGVKEYGRLNRFIIDTQIEQIRASMSVNFIKSLSTQIPELHEKITIVVGPVYRFVTAIIQSLILSPEHDVTDPHELFRKFHFIDINADTRGRTEYSTVLEGELDNWPLKAEFADVVLVMNAFSAFEDRSFLNEAQRVLKPRGYLVVFEISAESGSEFAKTMLEQISYFITMSDIADGESGNPWNLDMSKYKSLNEVRSDIENIEGLSIKKAIADFISFHIIVEKANR